MGTLELLLVAVGLSMDAFAVSVCKGLGMRSLNVRNMLALGISFGGFQALMPLIGWALGSSVMCLIEPIDHWIAFGLLGFIGAKMIWDALHEDEDEDAVTAERIDWRELLMLAIATSIDALAVGISLAALSVDIACSALIIGAITCALSIVGVLAGRFVGARFQKGANVAGGIVLICIGTKVLLEHLGFLG